MVPLLALFILQQASCIPSIDPEKAIRSLAEAASIAKSVKSRYGQIIRDTILADRIQCQENQPACHNCTRKKLKCEYPAPRTLSALRSSFLYSPSPVTSVNLQSTPTVFTLTDMRLFHHYLLDAYPHLPVGNDSAWLTQVPLIAHHVSSLFFVSLLLADASNRINI